MGILSDRDLLNDTWVESRQACILDVKNYIAGVAVRQMVSDPRSVRKRIRSNNRACQSELHVATPLLSDCCSGANVARMCHSASSVQSASHFLLAASCCVLPLLTIPTTCAAGNVPVVWMSLWEMTFVRSLLHCVVKVILLG